ncbi:PH domain-containing protein [Patescibacteria group bacterium]|nr:PH domain-containing protein [Patescibacteria group bacterium]MBU1613214.1 PH domain-containing protein [Patescibacteria group bacterium]
MNINSFIHRKPYETKLIIARRHFITFVPTFFLFILLMLVPVGIFFLFNNIGTFMAESAVARTIIVLLVSGYLLSVIIFFFSFFIEFYLDVTIVTNDRMVDIEQGSLFARTVAEVDLYQIQDATSEVKGIFPSIFHYGTVTVQTAGTVPKFVMEDVPQPHKMRQILLDFSSDDKRYHNTSAPPVAAPA